MPNPQRTAFRIAAASKQGWNTTIAAIATPPVRINAAH